MLHSTRPLAQGFLFQRLLALAALGATGSLPAADGSRNEPAIADVISGKLQEARASWWGFSPEDSTRALQEALGSPARRVIVDKQAGPWVVDQLQLRSDLEILFEPGVEVLAKQGSFRGGSDALFSAWDCQNLRLIGPGATLRMRRDDYAKPPYSKAEWRHVLNLRGCTNVVVSGLTLAESGGDGIYIAPGRTRGGCRNVTIQDVVCDRNYRQGISVISAEDLLIERCVLKGTAGTAPAAGIDFEPNHASERLVNCLLRGCTIEDNEGYAVHIYARNLDGTSPEMSIRIEDCVTRGTNARSASIVTSNAGSAGPVKGRIDFVNCRFEDQGRAGITIGSKPIDGARLRLENCIVSDAKRDPNSTVPVLFTSRLGDETAIGGVTFDNLTIRQPANRPLLRFDDRVGLELRRLTGTIRVGSEDPLQVLSLDDTALDRLFPSNPFIRVPVVNLSRQEWLLPASFAAVGKLPVHRLRDRAVFRVAADKQQSVQLQLRHQRVGTAAGEAMPVTILDPAGKELAKTLVPLGEDASLTFLTNVAGVYQAVCQPGRHTVQMLSCSHPCFLSGYGAVLHFVSTPGEFFFCVPAGLKQFGLRAQGEGDGERVTVTVFDAEGRQRWHREDLSGAEFEIFTRADDTAEEIWRVRLSRAGQGVLEDHYIELRGIPALLGFARDAVLRPRQ